MSGRDLVRMLSPERQFGGRQAQGDGFVRDIRINPAARGRGFNPSRLVARAVIPLATLAAGAAFLLGPAEAKPSVFSAKGSLTSQSVAGPTCASPVGVCAVGEMKGTFDGPFEFVADRLIPADKPGVLFMTGITIIHDKAGDVRCDDSAALNTAAEGMGELVGLCEITGLTGDWAGASGYLQTFGAFDAASGGAEDYVGTIVLP
jgi:hypothetical protein